MQMLGRAATWTAILGLGAAALGACAAPGGAPAELARGANVAPAGATSSAARAEAPAHTIDASVPVIVQARRAARVSVTEFAGRSSDELGAMFEPAQDRLETCRRGDGGKIVIRVRSDARRTSFDVEPGSSLDPTERRCVLEALSASHVDAGATLGEGATVRPTGFTSLLTIAW